MLRESAVPSSTKNRHAPDEEVNARITATMHKRARVEIILNDTAGSDDKQDARQRLEDIFTKANLEVKVSLAHDGAEIVELARRAARSSVEIVCAGGGDGTINAVASALVGTNKALGVLPLGTLNHFAKDLHIPLTLEEAALNIIKGHTEQIDVGEVNGRIFLNNSSLGLYPSIVRRREQQQKKGYSKWLAFVWASLSVFRRYPFLSVRLSADGQEFMRRTPFVFIGNNEYEMDSFRLGGRSCLNAGLLSLHFAQQMGRWGLFKLALRALFGRLRNAKDFDVMCVKEVWIETRHQRLSIATDGEVNVMHTPLHYFVRPGALRVIVPETMTSDE